MSNNEKRWWYLLCAFQVANTCWAFTFPDKAAFAVALVVLVFALFGTAYMVKHR